MKSEADRANGYAEEQIAAWAAAAESWSTGSEPAELRKLEAGTAPQQARDVFMFFISGAKERAPAAAMATLAALGRTPATIEPSASPVAYDKALPSPAPAKKKPRPA